MLLLPHALAVAVPHVTDAVPQDPQLAILTGLCVIISGMFHISSVGRERARHRLSILLGVRGTSLAPLRRAMEAKARGQASAIYLVLGGTSFSASFLVQVNLGTIFIWGTAAALILVGLGLLFALDGYVSTAMRRMLQAHLRDHPFPFEDNIAMTREIGELFGVQSSPEDTLDGYLVRLREVLGIDEQPSRLFQVGVPSVHT